ncbi:VOC family protein [Undibacterium umbellatum]|uniref:Diguanylate cyclase n=1 Tax=Undibacterium umbellatum TaxID=2762300 RepID=A0ABR6ZH29_9BURK|nr:diguanylate cyclase [Undibacterium umbellatum]MBC3910645.1 diguanylate cyclase [Undibacterium umbellatum]
MPAIALGHYNLRGDRATLAKLRDFYIRYVGLTEGPRPLKSFGFWLYAGGRDVLHLSENRPGETRQTILKTGFDHVAFACSDLPAMLAILAGDNIPYRHATVEVSAGFATQHQIFFNDPEGNGIELNFVEA